jgi:hypothetical protein
LNEGLALAEETGEHWKHPLLFRRKGEILLQRRCDRSRARRGRLPERDRHRQGAGRSELRAARGARARQALPIDRPPRRSPRRARAGPRRLLADGRNAGDRRRPRRSSRRSGHPREPRGGHRTNATAKHALL